MAIRMGNLKLVRYDKNADTLTGKDQPATDARLYNLSKDIGETSNLAAVQPDKVEQLQKKWNAWNATLVRPRWGYNIVDDDGMEPGGSPNK